MAYVPPFNRRQRATLSMLVSLGLGVGLLPPSASIDALMTNQPTASVSSGNFIEDRLYYSDATYTTLVGHRQTNFCTREATLEGEMTDFYKVLYTRC